MKIHDLQEELAGWLRGCRNKEGCYFVIDTMMVASDQNNRAAIQEVLINKFEGLLEHRSKYSYGVRYKIKKHLIHILYRGQENVALLVVQDITHKFNELFLQKTNDSANALVYGGVTWQEAMNGPIPYLRSHPRFDVRDFRPNAHAPYAPLMAYFIAHTRLERVRLRIRVLDVAHLIYEQSKNRKINNWIHTLGIPGNQNIPPHIRMSFSVDHFRKIGRNPDYYKREFIEQVVEADAIHTIELLSDKVYRRGKELTGANLVHVMAIFALDNAHIGIHDAFEEDAEVFQSTSEQYNNTKSPALEGYDTPRLVTYEWDPQEDDY